MSGGYDVVPEFNSHWRQSSVCMAVLFGQKRGRTKQCSQCRQVGCAAVFHMVLSSCWLKSLSVGLQAKEQQRCESGGDLESPNPSPRSNSVSGRHCKEGCVGEVITVLALWNLVLPALSDLWAVWMLGGFTSHLPWKHKLLTRMPTGELASTWGDLGKLGVVSVPKITETEDTYLLCRAQVGAQGWASALLSFEAIHTDPAQKAGVCVAARALSGHWQAAAK